MKKAIVFLANGFEESEAVIPIDLLRRAGLDVTICSIDDDLCVESSHKVNLIADVKIDGIDTSSYDIYFLPGGMPGSLNLSQCWAVNEAVIKANSENKIVSAICAAPAVVLANLGLLDGKKATCYPGSEDNCEKKDFLSDGVVKDGNIITAKSAAYAIDLALMIIETAVSKEKADEVASAIYYTKL